MAGQNIDLRRLERGERIRRGRRSRQRHDDARLAYQQEELDAGRLVDQIKFSKLYWAYFKLYWAYLNYIGHILYMQFPTLSYQDSPSKSFFAWPLYLNIGAGWKLPTSCSKVRI